MVSQEELEKMSPEEIDELRKQNCPFCKIVSGDLPSHKVFEDSEVLAILDINPSKKGHVLILPKQHVPIMPIIPPPVFKKLFSTAKLISKSIKKAMLVPYTTLFIANGAVAGQQAAHFLFHVIPREKGDGLSNFDIKSNDDFLKDQESLFSSLKNNLTLMMANHAEREGKSYQEKPSPDSSSQNSQPSSPEEAAALVDKKREQIAAILESNPPVKDLLMNNPEEFKKQLEITPQLKPLFEGVDIDALSKGLQGLPSKDSSEISVENSSQDNIKNEVKKEVNDEVKENVKKEVETKVDEKTTDKIEEPSVPESKLLTRKPEVFLGDDPLAQKDKVFSYFNSKPKAKELLMNDLPRFKELLSGREDIQEIFNDVNLDKLSEKLIEAREYELENNSDEETSNIPSEEPVTTITKTDLPDKNISLEDSLGGDSNE